MNGQKPSRIRLFLTRRPWFLRRFLAGLPALLATAAFAWLCVAMATLDPQQARSAALARANQYFEQKDYRAARVGYERVARTGDESVGLSRFRLSLCLDELGEADRATKILDGLATTSRPGFAPAHVRQAIRLWPRAIGSASVRGIVETHLLLACKSDPESSEVNAMLGEFYLATGRPAVAEPYLLKAATDRPDLYLELASIAGARGLGPRARDLAKTALEAFRARLDADPGDPIARLLCAEALVRLRDFPAAVAMLRQAARARPDRRFPPALANTYLAWADDLARENLDNIGGQFELLGKGLAADPTNLKLLDRFSALIRAGGDHGARAREALQALVATGKATGAVRYALGLDAWESGRKAEALLHWSEAARLDPSVPAFANNLAWALAIAPEPDLPRALTLIDQVVAQFPNDPRFRETRGQILAKLNRWKEALPDLQSALSVYPNSRELHGILAEPYDHLDAPGMAAQHRRRAEAEAEATADRRADPG
jgi:tetratricopeptide (TPR) repeat protein